MTGKGVIADAKNRAGKEFLSHDRTRVDEATARVNAGAEKLQNEAVQAFDDAKVAAGSVVAASEDAASNVSSGHLARICSSL